jgi:hypothetical protein
MKNGLGNLAARDVGQLAAVLRNRLKSIQYRPELNGGFLAQTGLTLEPQPPWPQCRFIRPEPASALGRRSGQPRADPGFRGSSEAVAVGGNIPCPRVARRS